MPGLTPYPTLYEVNTRVLLRKLDPVQSRTKTLDDIPDTTLDSWAGLGFDWIWLLGVWETGSVGRNISLSNPSLREEYHHVLSDFSDDDVCGSCFAVADYTVDKRLGGNAALSRFRERLSERNLKLMLDFVPNHTALDHPWVQEHPEYYIQGSEDDLTREAHNYCRLGSQIFAYGRDPYFAGWPDTLQLNYAEPQFQRAMTTQLLKVAGMCDGVRCDMAMLMLPDVFERTWRRRPERFWPKAIDAVRQAHPEFRFLAEVYWDREWDLQQQGFDYTYDKRLYDRLRSQDAGSVRDHLKADPVFQAKSARFLENHDEPRAAATFPRDVHKAAAVISFFIPGLRFFHDGQFEGYRVKIPVHLDRGPNEVSDTHLLQHYDRLLKCLRRDELRNGQWRLLECSPAWDGNWTSREFICFCWSSAGESRPSILVTVNYSPHHSQCYVQLPFEDLRGRQFLLADATGTALYERSGEELFTRGFYLDLGPWRSHAFGLQPA